MNKLAEYEFEYLVNTYFVSWNGEDDVNTAIGNTLDKIGEDVMVVSNNPWHAETFAA